MMPVNQEGNARFEIAIMKGRPLICSIKGDKHKSFEVIGKLIDDVKSYKGYIYSFCLRKKIELFS